MIFITAPVERCGTNFVGEIIKTLNPDYNYPGVFPECFLFKNINVLEQYCDSFIDKHSHFFSQFDKPPHYTDTVSKDLKFEIGNGVLRFLKPLVDKQHVLLKCPDSTGINSFFKYFPDSKLIIVNRDGRDVVDSILRTWPEKRFVANIKLWKRRSLEIFKFLKDNEILSSKILMIKYEDLILDIHKQIHRLADFLEINNKDINWQAVNNIPLIGSSIFKGAANNQSWSKMEKPDNFNPLCRWRKWSFLKKLIFKIISGDVLIKMGYKEIS